MSHLKDSLLHLNHWLLRQIKKLKVNISIKQVLYYNTKFQSIPRTQISLALAGISLKEVLVEGWKQIFNCWKIFRTQWSVWNLDTDPLDAASQGWKQQSCTKPCRNQTICMELQFNNKCWIQNRHYPDLHILLLSYIPYI